MGRPIMAEPQPVHESAETTGARRVVAAAARRAKLVATIVYRSLLMRDNGKGVTRVRG
jgi:hypothetical protein